MILCLSLQSQILWSRENESVEGVSSWKYFRTCGQRLCCRSNPDTHPQQCSRKSHTRSGKQKWGSILKVSVLERGRKRLRKTLSGLSLGSLREVKILIHCQIFVHLSSPSQCVVLNITILSLSGFHSLNVELCEICFQNITCPSV